MHMGWDSFTVSAQVLHKSALGAVMMDTDREVVR